jgi:hypothetical protein
VGELSRLSRDVMGRVRDVPGYENVDVNWQDATPELQWKVDRQKATQLGLTFQEVAATIGTATRGTIASYYQENGFQYPILVQLPESAAQNRGRPARPAASSHRRRRRRRRTRPPAPPCARVRPTPPPPVRRTAPDRHADLRHRPERDFALEPPALHRRDRHARGRSAGDIQADITQIG